MTEEQQLIHRAMKTESYLTIIVAFQDVNPTHPSLAAV